MTEFTSAGLIDNFVLSMPSDTMSQICRVQRASPGGQKRTVGMTVEMTVGDRNQRGRFTPGNKAYRRGVAAKAALKAEITAELGGSLSATDEILLTRAVELLIVRPKSRTDAVRATNTANRILQTLRIKYQRDEYVPSLAELGL